ncbi:MAG TPA: Ig-like domain-containing protein [Chthoniobacterales bacterium]|nr:Ig-like domain-containing protein [Chthoniobacterales bacterium]
MKKKTTAQSAFFNLRVLFGTFLVMAGVLLVALGFSQFSAQAQTGNGPATKSIDSVVPAGFDCAQIQALGLDRQENLRAGALMIYCGQAAGGSASAFSGSYPITQQLLAPLAFGGADVDLVTGGETFASVTQSETYTLANPDNPDQLVVTFNDSRSAPSCYAGGSVSTDGGTTFTRLTPSPFCTGHGTNFGDPVTLYNKPTGTFHGIFLATGCGGQGIGAWTSTDGGVTWSVGPCVHTGSSDDRESGWADNNPASPFYGRMYVSWNDFAVGGGALKVRYSTDNGVTWPVERQLGNGVPFVRNTQITGDPSTGTLYVAGMDEGGGGFPHNNINLIYKSTDGGNSWANTYTGPAFPGPGVTAVGYFACMFSDIGGYWRHEGWGEPATYNNVVHLVYAQHGPGSDAGDVYYIRSSDGGTTFAAPFKLNTDSTTRPQWQPNISVSPSGTLLATWYDGRESDGCTYGNPAVPCYRMWSRKSLDNGQTWLPDDQFSDVVSPLPAQPDGNVQGTYAGDYDYGSAVATKHVTSWTDGRVALSGQSQQDAFSDRDLVGFSVVNTSPACGSIISTQPTDFVVNLTDPVNPATVQASDFTVNGAPADSFTLGAGNTQITFTFNSSPVTTQGVQTMHIPAGAFNSASDNMPNFDFTCTFRYDVLLLQVVSTVPPDGGTFSPAAPNDYQYDVNFNEPVDVASVQTTDLTVTGSSGPSVTGVSVINGSMTARFTLHMNSGGSLAATIAAGAITDQFGNSGAAFSGNYTVEGSVCGWSPGPDMPNVGVRSVGVYFPANGKFYVMGGRSSDTAGSDFVHPFEYDPSANSWTTKSASYPDNQVNNMACGVLTDAGTPYIYCVGGSAAGGTTAASRVFRYDPGTDSISVVANPWPGAMGTILPGGFSVFDNKLYILGGFNINVGMVDKIYEFNPSPANWVLKSAVLPTALGYIPTATIGSHIYTGGGSTWDGTTIHDSNFSFVYDPAGDTIGTIANIPRATGETRALNFNGQMAVMGGGRDAPNPSNEVDVYDPGSNSWSTSLMPFVVARRNFATDTNGTTTIWLAGGYAPSSPVSSMEIFECTGGGENLVLQARVRRQGNLRAVTLSWSPADGGQINVLRDGVVVQTTDDDGQTRDKLNHRTGTFTYQVCETDSGDCSNEVTIDVTAP